MWVIAAPFGFQRFSVFGHMSDPERKPVTRAKLKLLLKETQTPPDFKPHHRSTEYTWQSNVESPFDEVKMGKPWLWWRPLGRNGGLILREGQASSKVYLGENYFSPRLSKILTKRPRKDFPFGASKGIAKVHGDVQPVYHCIPSELQWVNRAI